MRALCAGGWIWLAAGLAAPAESSIDAAHRLRADHPAVGVVVLSSFLEAEWCLRLLARGAAGRL